MDNQLPLLAEQAGSRDVQPAYFTVGTLKFCLMTFITGNVYALYWFYRNWKVIRKRQTENIEARKRADIWPFWRALFTQFWMFAMGADFKREAKANDTRLILPVALLGTLNLLLIATGWSPGVYGLWWMLVFIPLLPFDRAARRLNGGGHLSVPTAARFSRWNIFGLLIGPFLLGLAVIGATVRAGDVHELLAATAWLANERTPRMMTSDIRLDRVKSGGGLTYELDISMLNISTPGANAIAEKRWLQGAFQRRLRRQICASPHFEFFRKYGVTLIYRYADRHGVPLATVEIPTRDCPPLGRPVDNAARH